MDNKKIIELFLWVFTAILMYILTISFSISATFLMLIAPVPFMIITRRYGYKVALISSMFAVMTIFLLSDFFSSFLFAQLFCLTGIAFGAISTKVKTPFDYMLSAIIASLFSKILIIFIFSKVAGINPFIIDPEAATETVSALTKLFPNEWASSSALAIEEQIKAMAENLSMLMPSILILFAALDSLLSYYTASYIIQRFKYTAMVKMPPFGEWRIPQNIFWALLVSLILDLVSRANPEYRQLTIISLNLLEVLRALFIIQGLSLAWHFMSLRKIHKILKITFVLLSIILAPLSYILYIVGIFDICYDLRKLIRRKMK